MARQSKPRYANPVNAAASLARDTEGLTVSVDMSTGDDDNQARVFGRIYGAQDDGDSSVVLFAEMVEDTRQPDPLREFAEWVVSLDGDPLLADRPTRGDMQAIVHRAREALGQKKD